MKVIRQAVEMNQLSRRAGQKKERIALVPTMGALHEGHLALFREGKEQADWLVVSLFVNPTQFDRREDFEKYPRNLEADLEKCRKEKTDIVFVPSKDEIYPEGESIRHLPLPAVAYPLEGRLRPGHFQGVVDVVSRLFRIVEPDIAIFGLKDYQQLRVIEEMVKEQKLDIRIIRHATIRTSEGLAISSRNRHLTSEGIRSALAISLSLRAAEELFSQGERNPEKIRETVLQILSQEKKIRIDDVSIVNAESLEAIETIDQPTLAAVAAFVEGIRLIDNCLLDPIRVKKPSS